MGTVIFTSVLLLIAVGLFIAGQITTNPKAKGGVANPKATGGVANPKATGGVASPTAGKWMKLVAVALGILAVVSLTSSIITIVPTKQVGIPVTFGKPADAMSNGLHLKAPWTDIVLMDATVQPLDATGDRSTIAKDADRSDVFVHNNVRWSIKEDSASSLYVDYKEFDKIGDLLVQPALRTTVAEVMSTYHPLEPDQPGAEELGRLIQARLQKAVGDRITIQSVGVTLLDFSEATKNRINALNIERGNTAIAAQKAETAAKEAEANRILSQSVSKDPNVLVSKCLDLISEGKSMPPGFQCWPGQSAGQSIIVGGKQG